MISYVWTRRDLIKLVLAAGLAPNLTLANDDRMITRTIPASGEQLPVIGLGTYIVFDVDSTADNIGGRRIVVDLLTERGGSLIDTSPMYNRAENIIGDVITASNNRNQLFLATKVWTDGKTSGEQQIKTSARLMNTEVIDLMQVHNLRDLDTHMATIRDWQRQEKIRYSGVTDYRRSALSTLESAMKLQKPDFIQINYSLGERDAERRVLPLAAELGIAVIVNRPFVAGRLFRAVGDAALPGWATGFAGSWGQFFLKFIISHPAVTCVIPATSKAHHMADNLGAGFGRLPDAAERNRMADFFAAL
jgi:diketogulonate reductase-like aldo/keto reductase